MCRRCAALSLGLLLVVSCGGTSNGVGPGEDRERDRPPPVDPDPPPSRVLLSVVGTNDLHGHIDRLPMLSGFVDNLRRAREADGGDVLLIDAGDMFQGTLESNLVEGASVVRAYNALHYLASTVGNHEFDFGPAGEATTPRSAEDDARGALKARAAEARFPLLTSNILLREGGRRVDWGPNMPPVLRVERAGVHVGVVGVTTAETLDTTIAANVTDLAMRPLVETIVEHATRLRADGVQVVIVTAHAGGHCHEFSDPEHLDECEDEEIFQVAAELPEGLVDVIVAGHSHQGVAHRVNGVAIIESYAYGIGFGRVDLTVDVASGEVVESRIHPPTLLCGDFGVPIEECEPDEYEGSAVAPVVDVARLVARDMDAAEAQRSRALGVQVEHRLDNSRDEESALGNLLADLMRQARPDADVALMNGGGIRAPIDEGELTYGDFYEAFPFDNRFARVRLTGRELEALLRDNLAHDAGILSVSGVRARARCRDGELAVELRRENGRRIRPNQRLVVLVSDYIATTSNPIFVAAREAGGVAVEDGEPMREAIVRELEARGGTLDGTDPALLDPERPRFEFDGARPLRCE